MVGRQSSSILPIGVTAGMSVNRDEMGLKSYFTSACFFSVSKDCN